MNISAEKWKLICEKTLNNYVNMKKRLEMNNMFSNFILTYYSISLIIYSITPKYFKNYNSHLSEYFSLIFSIVLLAFSLVNSNAKYTERIKKLHDSINKLKTLKREQYTEEFKSKYDEIVNNNEMRKDQDFYITIIRLKLYESYDEINRMKEWTIIWGIIIMRIIILLIPLIAFFICFIGE